MKVETIKRINRDRMLREFGEALTAGVIEKFNEMELDVHEQITLTGNILLNIVGRRPELSHLEKSHLIYEIARLVVAEIPQEICIPRARAAELRRAH
jgi:hypothetical protein